MVTISAVVFLVGARTMVVTTRISALQHIAEFDGIFALAPLGLHGQRKGRLIRVVAAV